jgi:lipoprotein-releasing system ATP-binding protein
MPDESPAIYLNGIERRYKQGDATLDILTGVDLAVWSGQSVALIAPSGAGKSTLLHVAGLLEHQDAGEVYINDAPTSSLNDAGRTRLRRTDVGFVYQAHHLLMEFTALENVMLPQMVRGLRKSDADRRARELLGYLGLKERVEHRPAELSGGEQQRVAIARAVANAPRIPWPTSRPETSIPKPRSGCSPRSPSSCAPPASPRSSRPTTWTSRRAWTGG